MERLRVAVLTGGDSDEREISLETGSAVADALKLGGHEVSLIDPISTPVERLDRSDFDIAFIALHGAFGEDGGVQTVLAERGIPFTGSNAKSSFLAFHKAQAKAIFRDHGISTPDAVTLKSNASNVERQQAIKSSSLPVVVKPEAQGSSIGIAFVEQAEQWDDAIDQAAQHDDLLLLETAIPGIEWTVPIIDEMVLPPIRITTPRDFYDFDAKYIEDTTAYDVIPVTDSHAPEACRLALQSCRVLGTSGICRVDLRQDRKGQFWVLEVNTIPGMTTHSLVPKSASTLGWSMTQLCERAISSALKLPLK